MGLGNIDGAETAAGAAIWNNGKYNLINPTTGLPVRIREGATGFGFKQNLGSGYVMQLWAGGTPVFGCGVSDVGTPVVYKSNAPGAGGTILASGLPGSLLAATWYYLELSFKAGQAAPGVSQGHLTLRVNGTVVATYTGLTVPGVETYIDRRTMAHWGGTFNAMGISGAPNNRTMPDGRGGSYSYVVNYGYQAWFDDITLAGVTLLLKGVIVGAPAVGDVITNGAGASIVVSDYDAGSTFQGAATARIWGYAVAGTFHDGDAVSGGSLVSAAAYVPASSMANGLEAMSGVIGNQYVLPMLSTANSGPNANTVVGGLASWQVAQQIPPNATNYLEDSAGISKTDKWAAATNTLPTDTISGVQLTADARQTDASITHVEPVWVDSTGTNTSTAMTLPVSYGQVEGDAWAMRANGGKITPADVSLNTGVVLLP